ncbi:Histidine kinase- DNA gyrase B- and HSP90-like ATPase [Carpediemonas membranifera]|uniref:Histidine kinase- DNA gyrase B- and HSP90-like ATPase n=1 Tax=Carpediemonas membranifera TaxID=201153 RepID=A0A8J6E0D1_9EUKA|nr:Histidine kinase- DNA gyrase B- and HSP90-like ATPase [Carpediemonas membranifera]|eukprot:KAG9394944.1 Histidine kinase- DNA gyrase B- and HSP90-like ATPase [Carpediemonas membranifera]
MSSVPRVAFLMMIVMYGIILYPTLRTYSTTELMTNFRTFYTVELPNNALSTMKKHSMCTVTPVNYLCTLIEHRQPGLVDETVLESAIAKTLSLTVGFSIEEAIENSLALNKEGYRMLLNIGGEHYRAGEEDKAVADTAKYIKFARMVAESGVVGSISIKPSQLGMEITPELFESNLAVLAGVCSKLGVGLEVDIEQKEYRDKTVEIYIRVLEATIPDATKPHGFRIAHQAEFRDTVDIAELIAGAGGEIRLVRGKAYAYEAGDPAAAQHWGTEEELQAAFLECARVCEKGLALATGWKHLIEEVVEAVGHDVETQFLYGLPWHKPTQDVQLEKGRVVTLYAISGDWSLVRGYVSRRGLLTEEELVAMDAEYL